MVLLWAVRDVEHRRAVNALRARTYAQAEPIRVGAFPTYLNPGAWHGVVETQNFFVLTDVDSSVPEVDPGDNLQRIDKPAETPATLAAKASFLGRVYLDWAKFPITETDRRRMGDPSSTSTTCVLRRHWVGVDAIPSAPGLCWIETSRSKPNLWESSHSLLLTRRHFCRVVIPTGA